MDGGGAATRACWQALGSSVELRVTDPAALGSARACVEAELAAVDEACSRFRADSEISYVNSSEGRPVRIGALLLEAIEVALRAARLTSGLVDPTLGRALQLAGYDRAVARLDARCPDGPQARGAPSTAPGTARAGAGALPSRILVRARAGWRTVELDRRAMTVRVVRGVQLDLGATAKAWAADRAVRAASAVGACGALVSLGGDIAVCGTAPAGGWRVRVTDDHRSAPSAPGQTVLLHSGGLATSSVTTRRWRAGGRDMHHVIDPRTGTPAQSCWRTVSVAAADCTDANIATTASIVRGRAAERWLAELALPARLVDHAGGITVLGGWPAQATRAGAGMA